MKTNLLKLISLFVLIFGFSACQVIDDGMIGVSKSFGKISEETLKPGVHWYVPVVREIETWDLKTRKLNKNLEIPSSEGLLIKVQAALLYRTADVVDIRTKIGRDFQSKVVLPTLNDAFRQNLGKVRTEEIINSQEKLTAKIETDLIEKLEPLGIAVQSLKLTSLELPAKFQEAVENKIEQEQRAKQKEFELTQAKQDAQIEVARAQGAAEAQQIVRSTLSAEYLQYLWISTLNENPNVIYVATEANMPVFRTTPAAAK